MHVGFVISEVETDFFAVIHEVHLAHEHLHGVHGLLVILFIHLLLMLQSHLSVAVVIFRTHFDDVVDGVHVVSQLCLRIDSIIFVLPSSVSDKLIVNGGL